MSGEEADEGYKVGYRRPPLQHRFQKGRSGNPSGGKRQPAEIDLEAMLSAPVTVREGGKVSQISKREAALWKVAQKALKGDRKSLFYMLELFEKHSLLKQPIKAKVGGVVHAPADIPWGLVRLMAEAHGAPPWSEAQLSKHRSEYLASRGPEQAELDRAIGYPGLEGHEHG